jgi:hypothetical protein
MNLETRIAVETRIARAIVKSAITKGYSVTIDNGGGWDGDFEVEKETNLTKAYKALRATDQDTIIFHKGPHRVGAVMLIYGNDGWDVIADHSISYEVHEILEPAMAIADKFERLYA